MVSAVQNVARWSALGVGLVYGFWHNNSLHKAAAQKEVQLAYQHKVDLINEAKAAYAKNKLAEQLTTGVITDPENPSFDLEKFISYAEQEDKQH
ncbi:putative ATP synthase subunit E, mitochondrial [Endogone sp. FLAS-F59071]|nr:putative ATP synthase subunit E, mitochondrial [Endogone sp. FLAS-F59071]|eukprot:RUS21860.1 putative ATP synthase subunit E, mitochondrial [Endogone sp. FLAS-F59071]